MIKINHYIKKAITMPPHILAQKLISRISVKVHNKIQRKKDIKGDTHINFDFPIIKNSHIGIKELDTSNIDKKVANYLSKMYCAHRFDLLGSGWVKNSYDSDALGLEGYMYNMNRLVSESINKEYESIDWQKDYKSGYRWSEKTWYKDHRIGHKLGVDIKVPWELARLQHLPQLAIFCLVDKSLKEQNIKEFKYQIEDFIKNNPPRMGVNWVCSMDVGIRASNMLIAFDMFTQIDNFGILDDKFKQLFSNSIYEHGLHIINNLEWSSFGRNNHYLSNIAGLVYISSYLESTNEINQWLAFAIQEIISEMNYEFYEDGGNFESSTSYHRLSGELMVFSTTLILALKEEKIKSLKNYSHQSWKQKPKLLSVEKQQFKIMNSKIQLPQWYIDRLYKIGRFTVDITKPNGEIPQFGDNDSGRFFRLSPNGKFITNKEATKKYINLRGYIEDDNLFWNENILNHSTFISAINGLYKDDIFNSNITVERSFIQSMAKRNLNVEDKSYREVQQLNKNNKLNNILDNKNIIIYRAKSKIQNLKLISFPNSGIFIFKADNLHLAICATPLGRKDNGGHAHNDKLNYELWLDGKSITKDAGTYLYTPLPDRRNEFRSIKAHNVPIVEGMEQNSFTYGSLFGLEDECICKVLSIGKIFIEVALEYKSGIKQIRKISFVENEIRIEDFSNKLFKYSKFDKYSSGYGKVEINEI